MKNDPPIQFSIVVPFFNEQENIPPLYMRLTEVMDGIGEPYELVFVDDGSKDNTFKVLSDIYEHDRRVNIVRLRGKNRGGVRPGQRLAPPAQRRLADAAGPEPRGQLDDGEALRHRIARFRNDFQSLSTRDHPGDPVVRRTAPFHPGTGRVERRENCGSADRESSSQKWQIQLRNRPHDSRVSGFDDREVFAGLFHAAAAILRISWNLRRVGGDGDRRLSGNRQTAAPHGHHLGARTADAAGRRAVPERRAATLAGLAGRNHLANLLRISEQVDLRAARSKEPPQRNRRFRRVLTRFGQFRTITSSPFNGFWRSTQWRGGGVTNRALHEAAASREEL